MIITTKVLGVAEAKATFSLLLRSTRDSLKTEVRRSTERVKKAAVSSAPVGANSRLRSSIASRYVKDGMVGIVEALAPYARWVEGRLHAFAYGRRPGRMPPYWPIYQWVAFKGLPKEAVFPIMRKIGKKGTKAQPFLTPAFAAESKLFAEKKKEIIERAVDNASKAFLTLSG